MKNYFPWNACYFLMRNEKEALLVLLEKLQNGAVVLDLWAGKKPYKSDFEKRGCKYSSIDFEGDQDFICDLNEGNLPIENEKVDAIVLFQVMEHIYETQHILAEIQRVLKPGGFIFISTPFLHAIHWIPHDHNRFTDYFYDRTAHKYGWKILSLSSGVYGWANVIMILNHCIDYFSFFMLYRIMVAPIIILWNTFIFLYNQISRFVPEKLQFALRKNLVSDYAVIYQKIWK